ncbi:DUF3488 and transglutaminase-like domain-containing protein [Psychrobium sp. MM17-31]|uniref:transglutaminase TgpA family protein n=1 Tax=Psychrobium sp. MM17-31 TaxID=2917758 RepID=UPI001EF5C0D9|nr:DUF3488 and transglutaminase-like domain-containing protein [Psychrobium sp. MM17-31]MCG7532941.1 DUF3488 and transglutaminase-like domain-containing protein [Psychrobium sp. MM17-31]
MNSSWLVNRHIIVWMMAAYFISLLMLFEHTPWWILLFSGVAIGWRWLYVIGKVSVFNRLAHHGLTISAVAMLIVSSLGSGMMENMVNLLLLAYGLKFIELRQKRDVFVLVLVGLITIAVTFIYSESLATTLVAAVLVVLQLSILVALHAPQMKWHQQMKMAGKIAALSLPMTISLFLIMPQLGPLWSVTMAGGATTGLSDNMSPGDIASLRGSSKLAFSVTFDGEPVPERDRYWRALVLDRFDGRAWQQRERRSRWQPYEDEVTWPDLSSEPSISYRIIAKSSNQHWLFGLNVATSRDNDVKQMADLTLKSATPLASTTAYNVVSYPQLASKLALPKAERARNLQLPEQSNLQTKAWVAQQRPLFASDLKFAESVLRHFNQQPFYYTLEPPLLGENSVDEFLFSTQRGFCSHYSSAFTLMMRYAGIPARVVTGYKGGEWNEEVKYLNVYQYDAHAWSEIWIEGAGWTRVDPTASIAPERVISSLDNETAQPFLGGNAFSLVRYKENPWLNSLRLTLADIEFYWSRWVVEYNNEKQMQLLQMILGKLTGLRIVAFTLFLMAAIGLLLWWQSGFRWQRPTMQDKFEAVYQSLIKQMARRGVVRENHHTASEFEAVICAQHPELSKEIKEFTAFYNRVNYRTQSAARADDVKCAKQLLNRLLKKI